MRSSLTTATAVVFAVITVAGCKCDRGLNRHSPEMVLSSKSLDFGSVQINLTHPGKITVRNDGSASLTLSEPVIAAPFGVQSTLPLTIDIGGEADLVLTYTPTVANQVDTGEITFKTDDPANVTSTISLRGQGITAAAVITPNPIDFGDVYVGDNKSVAVHVVNAGSNELGVTSVEFDPSAPPTLSGDLSPLRSNIAAGSDAQASVKFAPVDLGPLATALNFTFDPLQGGLVAVPVKGRGVQARPRVCFQLEGSGTETCSTFDPTASANTINVDFGKLCDNSIFPPGTDGGCTQQTGQRRGFLYVRNEGNVPVTLSGLWQPGNSFGSCDGGAYVPDFQFSNSPDAGALKFNTASTPLPLAVTDPTPWETAPVTVTYAAHSACGNQTSDVGFVVFSRGDAHQPISLSVNFTGGSLLPSAQKFDVSKTVARSQVPTDIPFSGVTNRGDAPLIVSAVTLAEELLDAGAGDGPNGGVMRACAVAPPSSPCSQFSWSTDGGDPNLRTPIIVPAQDAGVQPVLGQLVFGKLTSDGGTDCNTALCPGRQYVIYGIVDHNDPYHPRVMSSVSALAQ
ncbi:MAG: choice-of-anchor D domain-containing protein [Myxococcaceae bacterium]